MKLTQISLLLGATLGVMATAQADTSFREALQSGKVDGEVRNVVTQSSYTDAKAEAGPLNNNNTGSSALRVNYQTAAWNGLTFAVGFQSGIDWGLQDKSTGSSVTGGEDETRNTITSTGLIQGYVNYDFDKAITNTSIRVGRQNIVSPLLMNSSAWPMKDAFDAVVFTNKDLPQTEVRFMYVTRWLMRYGDDSNGSVTQTDKRYDNPVWSVYLMNKSITGLDIELQWLDNNNNTPVGDPPTAAVTADAYKTGFAGIDYKLPNLPLTLSAKYMTAQYDTLKDSGAWGVQAKSKLDKFSLKAAYTKIDDANNFPGTLGHVPQFRSYSDTITDDIFAGLGTTSFTVGYDFGIEGFKPQVTYAMWNQSDEGMAASGKHYDGGSELNLDLSYKFAAVPGLMTRLQLGLMNYDRSDVEDNDMTYMKLMVNYSF
ncbi:hypothetical protein KDN34_01865 [Shewanella yunxiaonensis]|uniref:Outer membrane porin n=1 Tax=Shewanella yunxiaonensis TaxID=2829809 RepID=A0ABX7YTY2_9GAMM|nr:hypothetical protein [Shewanella yunxiaonensis]QUN06242.1 hypothetical protein KDN34_01865 [Shewanella yunxiaonensis]